MVYIDSWISGGCLRRWCSGNINAFQAFALGSIPGRRSDTVLCCAILCDSRVHKMFLLVKVSFSVVI